MTSIAVETVGSYQADDRSWLVGKHGTEDTPSVALDVSAFTANTHYPNGYLKSGIVLGKITATGKYGPYDNAAVDGRETAAGILFSAVKVPDTADTTKDTNGAVLVHGFVIASKLTGSDANAQTDLRLIHFG